MNKYIPVTWSDDKKFLNIHTVAVFEREGEPFTIDLTEIW